MERLSLSSVLELTRFCYSPNLILNCFKWIFFIPLRDSLIITKYDFMCTFSKQMSPAFFSMELTVITFLLPKACLCRKDSLKERK